MTPAEFKTGLREIKESLRNITIQFATWGSVRPYHTCFVFNQIANGVRAITPESVYQ